MFKIKGLKAKKAWNKKLGKIFDDDYGFSIRPNKEHSKSTEPEKKITKDEIQLNFTACDPCRPKNGVLWNFGERAFVPWLRSDQTVTLFHLDSEIIEGEGNEEDGEDENEIEKKSDEGEEKGSIEIEKESKATSPMRKSFKDIAEKTMEEKQDSSEEKPVQEQVEAEDAEEKEEGEKPKKLLNQFNFYERSSQNYSGSWHLRDHTCQTKPSPGLSYRDICNQWIIYDAYENDKERHKAEMISKESKATPMASDLGEDEGGPDGGDKKASMKEKQMSVDGKEMIVRKKREKDKPILDIETIMNMSILKSASGLMMIERLVVLNEIIEDFKFFEDPSDEFREFEGTLLPLWKFIYEKAKGLEVTGISCSKSQPDMFAVSFANFSYGQYSDGMVVIFSIRNTAFPEQVWSSPKGAMCVDIHPWENTLVAVGLSDGNITVLNLKRNESNEPQTDIWMNIPTDIKHGSSVWSIKWGGEFLDKHPSFFSVGLDGRVISWKIGIPDIQGFGGVDGAEIARLFCEEANPVNDGTTTHKLYVSARCLAFHPKEKTVYLIGSSEGNIFLCSSLYASRVIKVFKAHFLPVAQVQFNYYHSDVFISSSEDWTIKIWDRLYAEPLYVFDIGYPVYDVSWASYSSTVFAAVTDDGKVLVYDLNCNKEKPNCSQQIVTRKKVKPLRIEINPIHPVIIVGDDRGEVNVLKLSPNLRLMPKDARGNLIEGEMRIKHEINKIGKLLSFVHGDPKADKDEKPKLSSE